MAGALMTVTADISWTKLQSRDLSDERDGTNLSLGAVTSGLA